MHRVVWKCGAYELDLHNPVVMGVLNVTPDSFSDGGDFEDPVSAVTHGERLITEGAAILDVGGESTRPGSSPVTVAEELARVRPVIGRLATEGIPISIDTRNAQVAAACAEAGASIINDVGGFTDPAMFEVAASTECGVVVMHMAGDPLTMQDAPHYDDVVAEVGGFLLAQAATLQAAGVARERIVIDPGIGFGKTLEHNLELIRGLPILAQHGYPVLMGASRKRFIGEITGEDEPRLRMGGSVAAALESVRRGAAIVRVHDVVATVQALAVARAVGNTHPVDPKREG